MTVNFHVLFAFHLGKQPGIVALHSRGTALLVGVALLYRARAGAVAQPVGFDLDLPPTLAITAGLVLQMVLMRPAGFVLATTVLFVAVAYALGSRRFLLNAAVGVVLCTVTYVAFTRGLGLVLPAGVLGVLLG